MARSIKTTVAVAIAALAAFGCATPGLHNANGNTLKTVALIQGEPNFSVDGAYQELEEGLYTQPELRAGKKVFAPLGDIIPFLGGEYSLNGNVATYSLGGHNVQVTVGSTDASADGQPFKLDLAPELKAGSVWVPVANVWEKLGAFVKWDDTRQRLSGAFILPPSQKLEDFTRGGPVTEGTITTQKPEFYGSADGIKLGDVILGYQNADGGWPKVDRDVNLLVPVNTAAMTGFRIKSTIDNDSTMKQMAVLAKVYNATKQQKYADGYLRGLDYVLRAQQANGGWQQFWPEPQGYKARITFNDDAIANVLEMLRDVASRSPEFQFVDVPRAGLARGAYERGIALILKTQLVVNGKKTGWCAQYDEKTLQPVTGRAFELASISGNESVNITRFLMSIDKPSPEIIAAVQSAIDWFDDARLTGIKLERKDDHTLEFGFDRRVVADPKAPPLWARFYDLQTGKPLFTARDGVKRDNYADVSYERRVKYNWYADTPRDLLAKDYPAWVAKWAPGKSVLK
ncbi:pectate lyase [Uliginosibacterium sp. H1]|uniref:pectate lyase n=1 Tax=Uliginosibacterium sp. H1 TaxID=3114757 RepID=UPI002E17388E|nr:pectate lyase [Uliginosibacterium sp. H1]